MLGDVRPTPMNHPHSGDYSLVKCEADKRFRIAIKRDSEEKADNRLNGGHVIPNKRDVAHA